MHSQMYCLKTNQSRITLLIVSLSALLLSACSTPQRQAGFDGHSASGAKSELVANAHLLLGAPYRYGGNRPSTGFDCSGFVQYTHATVGIHLPRTSRQQYRASRLIGKQHLRPGDLVFFRINKKRTISHVGIYIGKGKFIHAPSSGKRVSIARLDDPYWQRHYSSAGRVF
ncbi:MAG: C40 family peptidase [Thioalkalispiraceae bacterium]